MSQLFLTSIFVGLLFVAGFLTVLWILFSYLVTRNVEEPTFTVIYREREFEVRKYLPFIVAYTDVRGGQRDSLYAGFRILANYIFGANKGSEKIAMTTPVQSTDLKECEVEKIAMTAPVMQQSLLEETTYRIAFTMPSKYTLDTLPTPLSTKISFMTKQPTVAVKKFRGRANRRRVDKISGKMLKQLSRKGITHQAGFVLAQYDPPFSFPPLRRNEIQVEIETFSDQPVVTSGDHPPD